MRIHHRIGTAAAFCLPLHPRALPTRRDAAPLGHGGVREPPGANPPLCKLPHVCAPLLQLKCHQRKALLLLHPELGVSSCARPLCCNVFPVSAGAAGASQVGCNTSWSARGCVPSIPKAAIRLGAASLLRRVKHFLLPWHSQLSLGQSGRAVGQLETPCCSRQAAMGPAFRKCNLCMMVRWPRRHPRQEELL